MEHESPSDVAAPGIAVAELEHGCNGRFADDIDSTCSTPYVSAPSSPGRPGAAGCYFFSAPASPMHYILSTPAYSVSSSTIAAQSDGCFNGSAEFEFSAKYVSLAGTGVTGSMSSADELFLNGQIRPMKLSSHLQRPQILGPLLDVEQEEENEMEMRDSTQTGRDLRSRSRSMRRRTRSMSPSRNARFQWQVEDERANNDDSKEDEADPEKEAEVFMPSASASSSRSSSSGRNSKRWVFLKELLYRSKSEGRANAKEKFWHSISFSPSKDKPKPPSTISSPSSPLPGCESSQKQSNKNASQSASSSSTPTESSKRSASKSASQSHKTTNGVMKRRLPAPSAHEKLYTANRAQTEELRKRTFLPYRQGLLGCLGFSSRSYGAMNGLAKTLKTVS